MTQRFHLFFLASIALVIIIFVALVATLFNRGHVEFTAETTIDSPVLEKTDPLLGGQGPDVLVVYYGDFACASCVDLSISLRTLVKEYPEKMLIAWKDFPNASRNPESERAAIAARCAERQNAFWGYHDILMRHQNELGDELYIAAAQELDLRMGSFERCLKRESTRKLVEASLEQAQSLELTSAPVLFVNGDKYAGAKALFELRTIIESHLPEEES